MSLQNYLKENFNLDFKDLYTISGLKKIDAIFCQFLATKNQDLNNQLQNLRALQKSDPEILINIAKILEDFLCYFFNITNENKNLKNHYQDLEEIIFIRREFVQRNISKKIKEAPQNFAAIKFLQESGFYNDDIEEVEKYLAKEINILTQIAAEDLSEEEKQKLFLLTNYCAWALYDINGKKFHKDGALFILPQKIDHQNLVNKNPDLKKRDGFNLTDQGFKPARTQMEANYCIFCHKQEKDSCRTGLIDKKEEKIKIDPLGVELNGCPLQEKISEMNLLKSENFSISALAMAIIDNPMIAGTGHRICNDCMKSCIYQKQDPVDIPQIETRILKDILALPYGFEIYSLLTRWNPLNVTNYLPKENSGKNILICGLGPAGYTLAHYLLNEGHNIVGIDGLKIEPLNPEISGINLDGSRCDFKPIKFLDEIYEPLSKRIIHGFGGVAEYGITVRWDKNFLKIIRLLLERRANFQMFGGIRFGSTITPKIAFEKYNFDHISLCLGAGRPNIINIKNNFAKGIRSASDFLMALQLTGAFKEDLFTNLQVRMPAIIIGGGLTAVDTACEVQAYYLVQIKKFAKKLEILGKENFFNQLNEEEKLIAEEFLTHHQMLKNGDLSFLNVKILYRKNIQNSPAYRLNHQELNKAFEEGIEFLENISPDEAILDKFNHITKLKCQNGEEFSCKSLLVAAGTTPNISANLEDKIDLELENNKYFKAIKPGSVITKIDEKNNQSISFLGDLHPLYEGNVVKAMASARDGYKEINELLNQERNTKIEFPNNKIINDFSAKIHQINRLSDHVVEIFIKAPLAAQNTAPGQIFRLHNYHVLAAKINDQTLAMEGVAVTALSVDKINGIISAIVVEHGTSTSLISNFKAGDPCIFMGPSGKPTEIPQNEIVAFIGGGRGNQPLTALAKLFKDNGCKVLFFAGYKKNSYIVRQELMEEYSQRVIYAIEDEEPNLNLKPQNIQKRGTIISAIKEYFEENPQPIDRIFTIGNDNLMHEVAALRHKNLVTEFANAKFAITSLNAPMQCMLKGVCSQCLQKRKKDDGSEEYFYSCADQDQNIDNFNFEHLHNRCQQNSLSEKLSKTWLGYLSKVS